MSIWTELVGATVRHLDDPFRTRILEAGRGEPLLLLHGQGGSLENFRHNIAAYAEEFHVIALDLAWHGLSGAPVVRPELIPVWVEQVTDVLRRVEVGACHVEGQSMGGWIATSIALKHPELVRSMVLTTPMGLQVTEHDPDPALLKPVLDTQLATLSDLSTDRVRARIETLFKDPSCVDDEIVALRQLMYSRPETNRALREVATAYFAGGDIAPHRIRPNDLRRISTPTLVYWGTANIGGPDAGRALADRIPGAEYHCAEVGHWAQYERFEEHNEVVLEFLRKNRADSATPEEKS